MTVILKIKQICEITALSKATIYREIKKGKFPAPLQLTDRSVGWLISEVEEWINKKAKNREGYPLLNKFNID